MSVWKKNYLLNEILRLLIYSVLRAEKVTSNLLLSTVLLVDFKTLRKIL